MTITRYPRRPAGGLLRVAWRLLLEASAHNALAVILPTTRMSRVVGRAGPAHDDTGR